MRLIGVLPNIDDSVDLGLSELVHQFLDCPSLVADSHYTHTAQSNDRDARAQRSRSRASAIRRDSLPLATDRRYVGRE